jgi:hypothetical protein
LSATTIAAAASSMWAKKKVPVPAPIGLRRFSISTPIEPLRPK